VVSKGKFLIGTTPMSTIWRDTYDLPVPTGTTANYRTVIGDVEGIGNDRAVVAYRINLTDFGNGQGSEGIYLRFMDPFGNVIGQDVYVASSVFNVNGGTGTRQAPPEATLLSNGNILVTWNEAPQTAGSAPTSLFGRIVAPDGTVSAAPVSLLTVSGDMKIEEVRAEGAGFEVTTTQTVGGVAQVSIAAFSATGVTMGTPVITSVSALSTSFGAVTSFEATQLEDGSTLIAWSASGSLYGQRVGFSGQNIGGTSVLVAKTGANFSVTDFEVEAVVGGGFVVGFFSEPATGSGFPVLNLYTKSFTSNLLAVGPEVVQGTSQPGTGFVLSLVDIEAGKASGEFILTTEGSDGISGTRTYNVASVNAAGTSTLLTTHQTMSNNAGTLDSGVLSDGRILTVAQMPVTGNVVQGEMRATINDTRVGPLTGTSQNDVIMGRTGTDTHANDVISGLAGNDSLYGMLGNDTLDGGAGNDVVSGNEGNDVLVLGTGDDYGYVGTNTTQDYAYGGDGNDVLVGDVGALDILLGDAGNDTIYGGAGNVNYMFSGTGNNVMVGGATTVDVFISEGTTDFVQAATSQSFTYRVAAGSVQLVGGTGTDQFIGGSAMSNDTVLGNAGNDYIYGGNGNDYLIGGTGNDVILCEGGNDTLDGGSGVNLLWANDAGSDQILVNVADGGTQVLDYFEAGGTNDVVRLLGSTLTSFAGIQNLVNNLGTAQGANLMVNGAAGAQLYLNLGANQSAIWFQGINAYSLTSADFLFG
jgi:Ca2+-binding RTX toxin-like protein